MGTYLGIGALHTVHRVVHHGEVLASQEGLDRVEVEDSFKKVHMLLRGRHLYWRCQQK